MDDIEQIILIIVWSILFILILSLFFKVIISDYKKDKYAK